MGTKGCTPCRRTWFPTLLFYHPSSEYRKRMDTREDADRRAAEWVRDWNARDIDAVLTHYHDDVAFRSPLAAKITGSPILQGKKALRAYWQRASGGIVLLHFELDHFLWDPVRRELGRDL